MEKRISEHFSNALEYIVISENKSTLQCGNTPRTAVFAYLFYYEDIEKYCRYLDKLPQSVDLYVITPDTKIKEKLEYLIHRNCKVVLKENRGRDMSGLLVAAKKYILEYEMVCFVHDKQGKENDVEWEVNAWITNLWMCSIGHNSFVHNVVEYMERHENVGLLVPPPPISKRTDVWLTNGWSGDYEKALEVKKIIGLETELDVEGKLITYGNVFWAKVDAIRKLINYSWSYEDFDPEPLAEDGTISHAIERMLGYVANEAGYRTKILINAEHADFYINNLLSGARGIRDDKFALELKHKELNQSYESLQNNYKELYHSYNELYQSYESLQNNYKELCHSYNELYQSYESLQGNYKEVYQEYCGLSYEKFVLKDIVYCYSGVTDFDDIERRRSNIFKIIDLCKLETQVYLCGDLKNCIQALVILKNFQVNICGLIITDNSICEKKIFKIPIVLDNEISSLQDNLLVVVCTENDRVKEIHNKLSKQRYVDFVLE